MVRRELDFEDDLAETIDGEFQEIFLGDCFGIGLSERNDGKKHILFTILVEDDGHWFASKSGVASAYWIPDLQEVLVEVKKYLDEEAIYKEGDGWYFK